MNNLYMGKYLTISEAAEAYDAASEALYGDRPNKTSVTRPEIQEKVNHYLVNKETKLTVEGEKNFWAKLKADDVPEIIRLHISGIQQKIIADMFGVTQATISSIVSGRSWTHITGLKRKPKSRKARLLKSELSKND